MINNKRQKITESMSLLDEEKEVLSSNTYLQIAEALNNSYKAAEGFYVLKWIHIVPVSINNFLGCEEGDDCVAYKQTPCSSVLPLTLEKVKTINRMIQSGEPNRSHFWENIGYTSVPLFGEQTLRINGEEINVQETNVLVSLVDYTGPID
jgi:hypothetical protein